MAQAASNYRAESPSSISSSSLSPSPHSQTEHPKEHQEKHDSKAKKPPKGPLSGLGTVYDDPAIIHVIEHAKNMADHEITPDDLNNFCRTGADEHETQCCPLRHCTCIPKQHRFWDRLLLARRPCCHYHHFQPTTRPEYPQTDYDYAIVRRVQSLELLTGDLDRRLTNLETGTLWDRGSTPDHRRNLHEADRLQKLESENAALQRTVQELQSSLQQQELYNKRRSTTEVIDHRSSEDRVKALQKECQRLNQRLAEEQKKSKQLEVQHVEFHKRQTEDILKINQLQQRIAALEAELCRSQQQSRCSNNNRKQQQQQQQAVKRRPVNRAVKQQQQQPVRPPPPQDRLPTPQSSPSSSHQDEDTSSSSVKEEDGYLIFNTNINGEVIHCRVKIPSSTASMRSSSPLMRPNKNTDFPLALVSPPATRIGSPRVMVPPLADITTMKKNGLNPNAPEWKNGCWTASN